MLDQDDSASIEGVRNIIVSWLTQTVSASPSAWIDLCQRIMARTTASSQQQAVSTTKKETFHDEESESLGASGPGNQNEDKDRSRLTARWRTQLFAMECLHKICVTIVSSGRQEHLDLRYAKQHGIPTKGLLANRIPDLIKMAFTSSAAYVTEIRLAGLLVLKDVVEVMLLFLYFLTKRLLAFQTFSYSPDPDYDDALLLEQHQAPITAALTPAFSSDSTPELLAFAVQVCAIFVGSGVIKDVSKMGRILKLLTGALDQSKSKSVLYRIPTLTDRQ
jgi:HEAT repeat-containing protein 5